MKPDFYYLETDGQVFLIKDRGLWRFPKSPKEIHCRFTPVFTIPLHKTTVLFAKPVLQLHPHHWHHKDEIIGRHDIDPIVQQAVNRTHPRGAAKVAIIEKGKVLLVKAARGLTAGVWNLPGGFIGYGEHPEETAVREVEEELGLKIRLVKLLGVYADTFARTGGYMISFVYLARRVSKTLRPHLEEIESVDWMPVRQALTELPNPFARSGLRDYLKTKNSGRR